MKPTCFERAIFISWYCSKRDCAFCYLSSRKHVNPDPQKDRRSLASIFAEAVLCKAYGWKVEFISGGCDTFSDSELLNIIKTIYEITEQKQWLNLGVLSKKQLALFKPYIEGVCGTVECITPKLRDKICPSKPLDEIEEMFNVCDELGIKKTITLIIGLGESLSDFSYLKKFIEKNKIDRITFYRLKGQKGTMFEDTKGPDIDYYVEWVKKTRKAFPRLKIVVGSWLTHLDEIHELLRAGAESITKFPSIRKFNTKYARKIEDEARKAKRKFKGTLTKIRKVDVDQKIKDIYLDDKLRKKINDKVKEYLKKMKSNC